jgi:hypothetical protein
MNRTSIVYSYEDNKQIHEAKLTEEADEERTRNREYWSKLPGREKILVFR